MEVGQVEMEPSIAKKHYLSYRGLLNTQRTECDDEVQASYLELSRGHPIINANNAMKIAGFNDDETPRLAFAKANWRSVRCAMQHDSLHFTHIDSSHWYTKSSKGGSQLHLKSDEFDFGYHMGDLTTLVPDVPPAHRPKSLERYWICWEVDDWTEVPSDPLLLRRLNATTFSVLAAWDLTEIERMVLSGRSA